MLLYSSLVHVPQQQYSCRKTRERQLVHGTPVQLLRSQTEAVAYKPTLARPSVRNNFRCGIGGRRFGGCVRHCQEFRLSPSTAVAAVSPSLNFHDYEGAGAMIATRRARNASGCRRRSFGVESTSGSCALKGCTCWGMMAVARFQRRHPFPKAVVSGYLL